MNAGKYYREFVPTDIARMELHEVFLDDYTIKSRAMSSALSKNGLAFTVVDPRNRVLAVVGITFIFSRVGEVWTIADKRIKEYPIYYLRAIKQMLDAFFDALLIERVQITIRTDAPWALKFGTFLGMHLEGVLEKYGEECKKHYLFAKVRA